MSSVELIIKLTKQDGKIMDNINIIITIIIGFISLCVAISSYYSKKPDHDWSPSPPPIDLTHSEYGKSLIITGSQGDGKSQLARVIASNSNGKYYEVNEELSITKMKQMVIDNPGIRFIFTTNERFLPITENDRRFIVKTINELINI